MQSRSPKEGMTTEENSKESSNLPQQTLSWIELFSPSVDNTEWIRKTYPTAMDIIMAGYAPPMIHAAIKPTPVKLTTISDSPTFSQPNEASNAEPSTPPEEIEYGRDMFLEWLDNLPTQNTNAELSLYIAPNNLRAPAPIEISASPSPAPEATLDVNAIEEDVLRTIPSTNPTLRQIHQAILMTTNFMDAAEQLGYYSPDLLDYLWKLETGNSQQPHTDYLLLQKLTEENAAKIFPDYDKQSSQIFPLQKSHTLTTALELTLFGKTPPKHDLPSSQPAAKRACRK